MKRILSRRAFLQGSAAAAGGLAVAKTIRLEGQPLPRTSRAQRSGSVRHDRNRDAGLRSAGQSITIPGVECVAAADLYDGRHTLAKEITGNSSLPTTRRYQELLDNKDIDCIVAAVPDHWHAASSSMPAMQARISIAKSRCRIPCLTASRWWMRRRRTIASCRLARSE